jgi:hypothetical protein
MSYGEWLRTKNVGFKSVPGGTQDARYDPTPIPMADPSWEKGIITETRPDGSRIPMLDEKLNPLRVKRYGEEREVWDTRRKELATQPRSTTQE